MEENQTQNNRVQEENVVKENTTKTAGKTAGKSSFLKNPILWVIVLILVVVGIAFGTGTFSIPSNNGSDQAEVDDSKVVATVNSEEITQNSLNARVMQFKQGTNEEDITPEQEKQLETQALDALISERLINQDIKGQEIEVTDKEIDDSVQQIKDRFETEEEFNTELETQNLTLDQLKENISLQLVNQKYLSQNIDMTGVTVTEEEITQVYNQAKANQDNVPELTDELKQQINQQLLTQKQNALIAEHIEKLKEGAEINKNI